MSFNDDNCPNRALKLLSKNLSYADCYHRKVYYPNVVGDRLRKRLVPPGSRDSLGSLGSSSSLPDIFGALLAAAEDNESSELTGLLRRYVSESSENLQSQPCGHTGQKIMFSTGASMDDDHPIDVDNLSSASNDSMASGPLPSELMNELELMELVRPLRRRRSSSLRRHRSPNSSGDEGQPRKAVRFADTMGLSLGSVKLYANRSQQPPSVPSSALNDLRKGIEEAHVGEGTRYVGACFKQPCEAPDFLERVRTEGVVLERCIVGECDKMLIGSVCVANLSYHKLVHIRYTVNRWLTFDNISASYVLGSSDAATDHFAFSINLPKDIKVGGRLEFAVRYDAVDIGRTFWDNNRSENYTFECFARSVPIRESDFAWLHFL